MIGHTLTWTTDYAVAFDVLGDNLSQIQTLQLLYMLGTAK